jgi:uncharacterized membrane protein
MKTNMKNKTILVSLIAILAIAFALNCVVASDELKTSDLTVVVNDMVASDSLATIAGDVSEMVPVDVKFTALEDASDVRVKVYIEGYKSEIYDSTDMFHVINGSRYIKRFNLELPGTMDLKDLSENLNLLVRISAKGKDSIEQSYELRVQKSEYALNILSVDVEDNIAAGDSLPVDVVLQNNGNDRLDNNYVKVSIPELGIEKTTYFGDLKPVAEDDYEDIRDTASKRVYLTIPRGTSAGVYTLEVEAYNYDAKVKTTQKVVVSGTKTGVLPYATTKTVAAGEQTTFEVVLVNPNDRMVVYSITPEESKGLLVDITEPIATVAADSSKTVQINVKATNDAEEGTHVVKVNVISESGEVRPVTFTLNVEGASKLKASNTVLVVTIVLSVIFVVLLIVLIVLLTKRPAEREEFGETSYY